MDGWQKAQTLSVSLSAIAVPLVLAVLGHQYNVALKEREAQSKFVELAVSILVQPAKDENRSLRVWATEVVNRYSGVKFAEQTRTQLIDKLSFPNMGISIHPFDQAYTAMLKSGITPLPDVRSLLAELGYYNAPTSGYDWGIEGAIGAAEAIRRFQKDRGLPVDGILNKQTLDELKRAVDQRRAQTQKK